MFPADVPRCSELTFSVFYLRWTGLGRFDSRELLGGTSAAAAWRGCCQHGQSYLGNGKRREGKNGDEMETVKSGHKLRPDRSRPSFTVLFLEAVSPARTLPPEVLAAAAGLL